MQKTSHRRFWYALAVIFATASPAGCRAQPAPQAKSEPFAPTSVRTLRSFGALGNGQANDTAAIARALQNSDSYCLDGERRSYRIAGTLRVTKNLCLRNTTLVQTAAPVDTTPYINRKCPLVPMPSTVVDCGDPPIPADLVQRLWKSLSIRTLMIRPEGAQPIRVTLYRVKVDRGPYAEGGARSDSAGVWLERADRVDFRDVEISGQGKGYGLLISDARNVTLTNLWIHDLVWAPYRGDRPLSQSGVAKVGWNSVPIHEFRDQGREGASVAKFYGVRIQEQVTCASLANVTHVRIRNARVERCMARFDTGDLPWQADGLDFGRSSSDIIVNGARIDSTWEGMDVVAGGEGINGLMIDDLSVTNSFSFGLKMGYQLRNARVSRLKIDGVGLAGLVIYGPVRHVQIAQASIRDVGIVHGSRGGTFTPWPRGNRSGVRFDEGSGASGGTFTPDNVVLEKVSVSGGPRNYEFGILNTGGNHILIGGFHAEGFGSAAFHGL